jgi:hypothetical protein
VEWSQWIIFDALLEPRQPKSIGKARDAKSMHAPCWASADELGTLFSSNTQRSRFRDEENIGYDIVSAMAMGKSQHSLEWALPVLIGQAGAEGRRNFISALAPHKPPGPRQICSTPLLQQLKKSCDHDDTHCCSPRSLTRLPVSGGESIIVSEPEQQVDCAVAQTLCGGSHILEADSPANSLLTYECIILLAETQWSL